MAEQSIKKIALHGANNEISTFELNRIKSLLLTKNVESQFFIESDDIDKYNPDCVIVLTPQEPKLTKFPTYGLMHRSAQEYLSLPRYIRNLLTYDGYLTISSVTKEMLEDLTFGARKLNTSICFFDFTNYITENNLDYRRAYLHYFEPNILKSPFKKVLTTLSKEVSIKVSAGRWGLFNNIDIIKTDEALRAAYQKATIGLILESADDDYEVLPKEALQIIASGAVLIAPYSKVLKKYFDDGIYYFSPDIDDFQLNTILKKFLRRIQQRPEEAKLKANKARELYKQHFHFHGLFDNFCHFHTETLRKKGFVVDPKENPNELPSVSYIIRTGGKHRQFLEMALNSLAKQNYPSITVIFVIHKEFNYLNEIIAQYPTLTFKVIYNLNSIRSTAIRDGMAAVETDLFGMLDDDDELHPNHIRTMVKALNYHHQRDWRGPISVVYSGSIIVNKKGTFETDDEFLDTKLNYSLKKRCIEHFRFYRSLKMANHRWFMMSNSWLARKSIIDEELLTDPQINTCEDLYFELQFAQRTHFAFSGELTAFHHFHSDNSTIVDNRNHIPDTRRIALRNAFRTFAGEFDYDNYLMPFGENTQNHLPAYANQPKFESSLLKLTTTALPFCAPQYYSSYKTNDRISFANNNNTNAEPTNKTSSLSRLWFLKPFFIFSTLISMDAHKRKILLFKAKLFYQRNGLLKTIIRVITFIESATGNKLSNNKHSFGAIINRIKRIISRMLTPFIKNKIS